MALDSVRGVIIQGSRIAAVAAAVTVLGIGAGRAAADVPLAQRTSWSGAVDFFATGAPMATDGPDGGTDVDQLAQPATVTVTSADVPEAASLLQAYLYWSGSINNNECATTSNIDNMVDFTSPGAAVPTAIVADICYCSDAGATSYDIQVCRADVTAVISGALSGTYIVDRFAAHITNAATDNASFSLVLVYTAPTLLPRRVALYDGLLTMSSAVNASELITLGGLDVDDPAQGDLTWYTLEGDVGGAGLEQVSVAGAPGGGSMMLSDAVNPAGNPMNHTINTVTPARTDTIGVDLDRFDISSALTPGDTAVDMLYEAGTDKWWIAYNIVGINVVEAVPDLIFRDGFESGAP